MNIPKKMLMLLCIVFFITSNTYSKTLLQTTLETLEKVSENLKNTFNMNHQAQQRLALDPKDPSAKAYAESKRKLYEDAQKLFNTWHQKYIKLENQHKRQSEQANKKGRVLDPIRASIR